ncbi:MAG: ribosomal protein S18 acetylase RimI-like enzyme [Sulfurimonas sp.]|jgi:ribosomal protein S18 acetylase RimI-like enzyme
MKIEIKTVDYLDAKDSVAIVELLEAYSQDPMGGAEPLTEYVKENLASKLSKISNSFSVICYVENKPAGLITCFENFSTFKCKPLISIHDIIVSSEFRGLGISQQMLSKVEEVAKQRDCCKITLEVLEGNKVAQNAYEKFGFESYELDPEMGKALFWQKNL